jgi:hypothetical protein
MVDDRRRLRLLRRDVFIVERYFTSGDFSGLDYFLGPVAGQARTPDSPNEIMKIFLFSF